MHIMAILDHGKCSVILFPKNNITKTKICESDTTFFNFVNLPKREKIPLKLNELYPSKRDIKAIVASLDPDQPAVA